MKSERAYRILVVLLLIFPARVFSQQQMPLVGQNSPHVLGISENFSAQKPSHYSSFFSFNNNVSYQLGVPEPAYPSCGIQIVRPGFATEHLPFFCKKEFQFEKSTSIPLRVRLGSLDYVNRLEGKR